MPPAEARLWNMLRAEPMKQFHFRRQVPIGPYFADFASHAAKLVIEVDGETHGTDAAKTRDLKRDAFLKSEGYRVVRVTNDDVIKNLDGVGVHLLQVLKETPTRHDFAAPPSPQGGGIKKTTIPNGETK